MDVPGNKIGDSGATALVEGLKEMRDLKELSLLGEFCTVAIGRCDVIGIEVL